MNEVLIIDIGGTKTNVSLVGAFDGGKPKILSTEIFKTSLSPKETIQKISSIYNNQGLKLDNISLSLPGRWDENGVLKESFYLCEWLDYPFIENLKNELKIKNIIWETDVICGGLGEYHAFVETLRATSLLYINLGTGVGASLIVNGKPFKSNSKLNLRLQKLVIPFQEELYSGVDLISGGSLLQNSHCESMEALFKGYKAADVEAIDIISRAQYQLAAWIINLFYLFGPDVIVLNGGLTNEWDVLAEGAIDIAHEELEDNVEILPSKLKDLAPIYGAYVNARPKSLLSTQEFVS